ncbi:hypothetical protein PPTG_08447 [Phytophthora nicotianae INRA-310]|uniref:Uncharacterized protein n=1 Tax=Phytophthora nicotianae (strain INRA-310) TaxID=761204 RepID=W2QMG3_PHYN3|nr:hypothetical protein PPTG_08447 [Phytophthora nicotianae INRA-310]ETN13704.1 hypothetical protein PPTG_08447 [Phytophthora nicotianae INRA-310]
MSVSDVEEKSTVSDVEMQLVNHQNCVIAELVSLNQDLVKRVSELENRLVLPSGHSSVVTRKLPNASDVPNTEMESKAVVLKKKSCGTNALSKSPAAIWYEWYAKTPRLWDVSSNRQKKSAYKQITNYMKLFLPEGFALDPSTPSYCDEVMRAGMQVERCLFEFFGDHGIKSRNGSSVLKQLRKLHREGKLELLIKAYVARVNTGKISDPAPNHV